MRVLYISYNGLQEPLGRNQVLPYISGLAGLGHTFTVLSFEKPESDRESTRQEVRDLLPPGTRWLRRRYHRRPSLPATAWDTLVGAVGSTLQGRFDLAHARSTVPAAMARAAAAVLGIPWIFDVRGFVAAEYVDGNHWPADSLRTRLTAAAERRLLGAASGLVFLTARARDSVVTQMGIDVSRTEVIPCAVDLDRFRFRPEVRAAIRERLGLGGAPVMVYSGSLGSWYLPDSMLDLLEVAEPSLPGLHFLVLSPQAALARERAARRGLDARVTALTVAPPEVPDYLSAADFGVSFIEPSPSKAASSPTKLAEYLACGLPVVLNPGVGDVDTLGGERGWILTGLDRDGLRGAAARVASELAVTDVRAACRETARRHFALEDAVKRYDRLYQRVTRDGRA